MKLTNIFIALIALFSVACSSHSNDEDHGHPHSTEEHGHPHDEDADHSHESEDHHDQEEFTIENDSSRVEKDSTMHTHEDGTQHPDH